MDNKKLEKIRHSTSHVLAMAVLENFPNAKFAIGPSTEDGFYYDFDLEKPLINKDLKRLQKSMHKIISKNLDFTQEEWTIKKALDYFEKVKQPYKIQIIKDLVEKDPKLKKVSIYKTGGFVDLCAGPHIKNTKEIKSFKLLSVAGAYWRGDEKNKMLQRVYGTAFESQDELDQYLIMLEEAKKRDHRELGKRLELFIFDEEVGPGLPLWLPKGAWLRKIIMDYALKTYLANGYEPVSTPHITNSKLFSHSGHLGFYAENIYEPFGIEGTKYLVKPMNCPFHVRMYNSTIHSYKELPMRWTEMGTVYRYERSGTLHGLTRVRGFTQDDAHIICTPENLHKELVNALKLTKSMLKTFGFKDFEVNLSVRDPQKKENFIGKDEDWQKAEEELKKAISEIGFDNFVFDIGGAVFYGPKIDIKVSDALGRKWQLSTIQVDFNLPSRFEMTYIDKDGQEKTPFMIHRALLGSLERFIGVLIEHYAGAFPVWLSPIQVVIMPIASRHEKFAKEVAKELTELDIRVKIDDRGESTGRKIRDAQLQKTPYMVVIGDKELKSNKVAVRTRKGKDLGILTVKKFKEMLTEEIVNKK